MNRVIVGSAAALLVLATSPRLNAQVAFRQTDIDIEVHADGTSVQTNHIAVEAFNDSTAQRIAQQPLVYSRSRQELTITDAYTQKAHGARLPVDPEAIRTEPVPGSSNFPLFNDLNRKVIIFPSVMAYDRIVYTSRWETRQPLFPGQFFWHAWLSRTVSWPEYHVTITAPITMPLTFAEHGMDVEKQQSDDHVTYQIRAAYPAARAGDPAAVGSFQRLPWVTVSTLLDYASLATRYAKIIGPKEDVTPEVEQLAARLTAGKSDRREQTRAIYDWVSSHIRYVGIWLEQGAVEPHAASAVLKAGYGDCKDHAVLFGALLHARGIKSEPVLINLGNEYALAGPPTFAVLNHVITWLPEFQTYADTTAEFAPFGVLPFEEYGKPVIHVLTSPSQRNTPAIPPGLAAATFSTEAALAADGTITGHSSTVASGPFSVVLRRAAANIELQGQQQAARTQLKQSNVDGTGSFGFPAPGSIDGDYKVTGDFHLDPQPELLDGASFALPVGLRLLGRPGDALLGPLALRELPDSEPTPCHFGTQVEALSLTLPQGRHAVRVPTEITIDNDVLHYDTHWTATDSTISVRRVLTSKVEGPLCEGQTRREAANALATIRRDLASQIGISDGRE
jgi:transglutaminase-like putative cysteine protease